MKRGTTRGLMAASQGENLNLNSLSSEELHHSMTWLGKGGAREGRDCGWVEAMPSWLDQTVVSTPVAALREDELETGNG